MYNVFEGRYKCYELKIGTLYNWIQDTLQYLQLHVNILIITTFPQKIVNMSFTTSNTSLLARNSKTGMINSIWITFFSFSFFFRSINQMVLELYHSNIWGFKHNYILLLLLFQAVYDCCLHFLPFWSLGSVYYFHQFISR